MIQGCCVRLVHWSFIQWVVWAWQRFSNWFFLDILSDKGYPLISWIMTPYEKRSTFCLRTFIQQETQTWPLSYWKAFVIFKKQFQEFLPKLDLNVSFKLDVFISYCILHHVLVRKIIFHSKIDEKYWGSLCVGQSINEHT
jgi:hypothetical protein